MTVGWSAWLVAMDSIFDAFRSAGSVVATLFIGRVAMRVFVHV